MKTRSARTLITGFFILFLALAVCAQQDNTRFDYLTVSEGLSSNTIRCIFKDHEGILWFGTDKGLNKYNGRSIKKFNAIAGDATTLLDDKIVCVYEDRLDRLWVGTTGGLNLFDRKKNNVKNIPLPKESFAEGNEMIGIFEDGVNTLYVVSEAALYEFDYFKGYKKIFSVEDFTGFSHVISFAHHNGFIYLGTWSGHLFRYEVKKKRLEEIPMHSIGEFNSQPLSSIYVDNQSLLLSINGKGLYACDPALSTPFKQVFAGTPEGSDKIIAIQKDYLTTYWLSTEYGIVHLDKNFKLIRHYTNTFDNGGLNNNYCTYIHPDNTNILWIGTRYGGVNKYDPNKLKFKDSFGAINTSQNEQGRSVKCFMEDTHGNILIGGDFGLKKFSQDEQLLKSWSLEELYKITKGIGSVASIRESPDGKLWLGNWGGGLSLFDPANGKNTRYAPFLKSKTGNGNCILNIGGTGDLLYLFTYDGMAKFNFRTLAVEWFRHDPMDSGSISNSSISSYCTDDEGNIWIGTFNGLNKFDPATKKNTRYFHQPANPNSIAGNLIHSLLKDANGNIWVATSNGLSVFDQQKKTFLQQALAQVSSHKVYSVQKDNQGSVWFSNGTGLVKFDLKRGGHKVYNNQDGVKKGLEYSYRGRGGKFFFGGINGITSFIPEKIIDNQLIPGVVIAQFKLLNRAVTNKTGNVLQNNIAYTDKITLQHHQSSFAFEYSALNYTLPEKNNFKYMLKGFDNDWTYAGTTNQATYTNIPPGRYVFVVLGSNNDGIWNTEGAKVEVVIHPPWYWNAWSKISYASITLLITLMTYRFLLNRQQLRHELELERLERHREEEKFQERFDFFTNVSHQIRTPLTLISGSVEQLTDELKYSPVILKRLETVGRNTQKLLILVNQLIGFKKFETEKSAQVSRVNLQELINELRINYTYLAQSNNVELLFETNPNAPYAYLDGDKLEKILNNIIHNAIKFTPPGGTVTLAMDTLADVLKITVADTGMGIAKDDMPNLFRRFWRATQKKGEIGGIGLCYAKDLVAVMGGKILVDSVPGTGTTFSMEFPGVLQVSTVRGCVVDSQLDDRPTKGDGKNKVLIVEDNDEMRHFILETLESNYCVASERDAFAGCETAKNFLPDLIISDVMMAGMDGLAFCRAIKSDATTSHIPVILLTADVLEESIISGYESGADDYVAKPFSHKVLLNRVHNLIECRENLRRRYIHEMFPDSKEPAYLKPDEEFLKKAIKVVENNYEDCEFDAIRFSQEMAVSRTLLYTKLKAVTGQSVNEFIRTIRLKKAALLLLNSNKQVTDIAFTVGFTNAAYFTKCFHDQFGVSPKKYAERNLLYADNQQVVNIFNKTKPGK